jgi:hypothetical protein
MPQVIGGEATKIDAKQWSCGDCADAGQEYKEEEAKVILHSVSAHKAFDINRDTEKMIVRAVPK